MRTDDAIDRGVEYLLGEVRGGSGWVPEESFPAGYAAVQLYALLKSDVSYLVPEVDQGLRVLLQFPPRKVYSVALALMAYDAVLEQIETEERGGGTRGYLAADGGLRASEVQRAMRASLDWLLLRAKLPRRGAWGYGVASRRAPEGYYDHSNTQFAVLALGVAARRGLSIPASVWTEVAEQFVESQEPEGAAVTELARFRSRADADLPARRRRSRTFVAPAGEDLYRGKVDIRARGWAYTALEPESEVSLAMTSAALSSALLAQRFGGRRLPNDLDEALAAAIRDGYGWLTAHLNTHGLPVRGATAVTPYDLYSLEKVGDIGEVESFGGFRWFEEGAKVLLEKQTPTGQWGQRHSVPSRHKTALALLYFARAASLDPPRGTLVRETGPQRGGEDAFSDRYWVYLPSAGRHVAIVRFFRRLRYQPDRDLVRWSEELVDAYESDYRNELVLFFRTLELSPFATVKAHGQTMLERVTGLEGAGVAAHMEWAERWKRVVAAGGNKELDAAPLLRGWLEETPSQPLRLKIVAALQRLRDRESIGALIELLDSPETAARRVVYDALQVISGQKLPFDPEGSSTERRRQAAAWREWWEGEAKRSNGS